MLGLGSLPGQHVWLFGSTRYDVAVHEQGHNLGLEHAHARECRGGTRSPGRRAARASRTATRST